MEISIEERDLPARFAKLRERLFHQKDHEKPLHLVPVPVMLNSEQLPKHVGAGMYRYPVLGLCQENL